jgi:VWFA-related protein
MAKVGKTSAAGIAVNLILLLLSSASAAVPSDRTDQPAVFTSGVSLVLLPVFIVDHDGRAVRGLTPEDFELFEDGKRAEVVSFRYVDTTSSEDQATIRQASAARRRFLLLFDKSFTDPAGLNRAQRAAADFVRQRLAESDLAAVATFDIHRGIRLVANFTEDRALLVHAVETLGIPSLTRISDPLGLAADLLATDIARPGSNILRADPQAVLGDVLAVLVRRMRAAEEESYRANILTLMTGFQELARALRRVEGRKQILYFSAGFDSRLLVGQTGSEQRTASESIARGALWEVDGNVRYGDARVRDLFGDMTKSLSSADAVVHTVDVTGLGSDRSLTQTTITVDPARDNSGREALNYMAAETGGRFFKDTNNLESVLQEMAEMTSRYYVLGFQPVKEKGAGAFHKVKVKVARKGVKLSHRAGYYERAPGGSRTILQRQFEVAQLVVTGAGSNDLHFSSLCLPFPVAGERQTLGIVLQVPKDELTWSSGKPLSLELYAYAVAEDGTVQDHLAQLVRIDPAQADRDGTARGVSFLGTLSVPPGKHTVRLLVAERDGGGEGVQFVDVTVPPYDPRAGFLLPPVVMEDNERWLKVEMARGRAGPGAPFPFQVGGKPFLPRASLEVSGGSPEKLVLIAYEPLRPGDPAASLEIRSSLVDQQGRTVPAGFIKIDRVEREENGRRTYLLGYTPEALTKGDYTLRISMVEGGERLVSYSLLRVRPGS